MDCIINPFSFILFLSDLLFQEKYSFDYYFEYAFKLK